MSPEFRVDPEVRRGLTLLLKLTLGTLVLRVAVPLVADLLNPRMTSQETDLTSDSRFQIFVTLFFSISLLEVAQRRTLSSELRSLQKPARDERAAFERSYLRSSEDFDFRGFVRTGVVCDFELFHFHSLHL